MSKLSKQIIINSGIREKRAALIENNVVEDLFFERDTYQQIAGNIYRGKVKDVLPGMQAAFIDIGLDKNAFLHIGDLQLLLKEKQLKMYEENRLGIQHVLQPGQDLMTQVVKEPIGTKGAKVTCKVSLPGRYFVFLPYEKRIGISRRISEKIERERLRNLASELTGGEYGVIVRTNTYQKSKESIKNDYNYLVSVWQDILEQYNKSKAPALIYKEIELIQQIARDYLSREIDKVVIDDKGDFEKLKKLAKRIAPDIKNKIYMYRRNTPIFSTYGIEKELEKAVKRKVWLNSGGYVVFDSTEALVAIDVNTGKFTGNKNLQDTVFKTNVEAAKEIARQLRLRDIGGIIIIDFIDMTIKENQVEVLSVLEEELKKDRTRTTIMGLTRLGLVELTRKKVRERYSELIQKECPYCHGTGKVMSETTMALMVIRKITELSVEEEFEGILLELHPEVAAVLIGNRGEKLDELEEELGKEIYIRGNKELHIENINILKKGSKSSLKRYVLPVKKEEKYKVIIEEKQINNHVDGIARIEGYIIIVINGGEYVGTEIEIEIIDVHRTFARGKII